MYKGFIYSDLFQLLPQSEKVSKLDFVEDGRTPAYSSDTSNNGCLGFVDKEPMFKISEERPVYLIFGDHTKTMNIVHNDFCVMDNVKVLIPKMPMSDEILLYVTTSWKKAIPNLGYARHWSKAQEVFIELPVIENSDTNHEYTVDDIDWQYMRDYITKLERERITELECERITELDAYLQATGLNNYELTEEDKKILSKKVEFADILIGELFNKVEAKCKKADFDKRKDTSPTPTDEFCIPLINAKLGDNGIMFYGRKEDWNTQSMCIDVIQNGAVATGKVYVQPQATAVLWDAYLIQPTFDDVTEYNLLYLARCIEKLTKECFSYEKKATWDRIKECFISIPIKSDRTPDFDYMEKYIRTMEKVVIADVVKYKDKVIETTKKVVGE